LKIFFFYNESEIKGKGNSDLFSVSKNLEKLGHEIILVLRKDITTTQKYKIYPILPESIKGFLTIPIILIKFLKLVKIEKPDIIIVEANWYLPLLMYIFSKLDKTPFIFNFRTLILETIARWKNKSLPITFISKIFLKINKFIYKNHKQIIASNQSMVDFCKNFYEITVPLIGTNPIDLELHKPIDVEKKLKLRKQFGIKNDQIMILYSGAITEWILNYIKQLCDVVNELSSTFSIMLVITGWGSEKENLKKYLELNDLRKSTILLPWLEHNEIQNFIASSDVCIDPFFRKFPADIGPPGKLREYMACGICTITTKSVSNQELISHKNNGLIYSGSKDDLKEVLLFILENSHLISTYGKNARITMETKHFEENDVRHLEKFISKILLKK
jgi:glycosyltransferase involved in cell wall biosynthesis